MRRSRIIAEIGSAMVVVTSFRPPTVGMKRLPPPLRAGSDVTVICRESLAMIS
jgi:hypothetical protein